MERVQVMFLSHVGAPSFAAVEQRAENACLVDVHFGSFSQSGICFLRLYSKIHWRCCLGMRCEGRLVNEGHATHKYSFNFGIGAEGTSLSRMDCFFLLCVVLKPLSC